MAETPADTFNEEFFEGFEVCLKEAISLPAFVKEFNRLSGCQLGIDDRKPIERMIDESTGYQKVLSEKQEEYMRQFAFFVWDVVYMRLLYQLNKEDKND